MRRLYTLLLYLALPFASAVVLWRGLRSRDYWRGWRMRFGFGARRPGGGLWVHAVSVGEVQVAAVLIGALRARDPALEITLTSVTPTGRARARTLLPEIDVRFAPYDLPGSLRRCLARLRPRLLVLIETELWPNLLHEARRAGVPVLIASARVSARSAWIYQRLSGLLRASLAANVWVGAQTASDAQRFRTLGADEARVSVVGNLKFDRTMPGDLEERGAELRAQYAGARPVWIAGSTHAGEESMVLAAHRSLLEQRPQPLLILAPRHPPRFDAVAQQIAAEGLSVARRSRAASAGDAAVLLLDTLGELAQFYAAADVAFVGGSLVPIGGHNLLEPAAIGLPVLTGPHQFNSPDVARALLEQRALAIVHDAGELGAAVERLLNDPEARALQAEAGRHAVDVNRGALERLLRLIEAIAPAAR